MTNLLGAALGRCLAKQPGLVAAYLPEGAQLSLAEAMVRSANSMRPLAPPAVYSILVATGEESRDDPDCQRLTPNNALQFRKDDRLAVVLGRHPDLESFVDTFNARLNQSYPEQASDPVLMEQVADEALDLILQSAGLVPEGPWEKERAVRRLAQCMGQIHAAYRELDQGTMSWNACWLLHIAEGLDALSACLMEESATKSPRDIGDFLAETTYACFALPVPDDGLSLKGGAKSAGRDIAEALGTWWSDADRIEMSIAAIDSRMESGESHPIGLVAWSDFGRTLAVQDNLFLAFLRHADSWQTRVAAFVGLSERDFFNPLGEETGENLVVESADGGDLALRGDACGPFFIPVEKTETDGKGFVWTSIDLRIRIPVSAAATPASVDASAISIKCSDRRMSWMTTRLELDPASGLWAHGAFRLRATKEPFGFEPKLGTLSIEVPSGDSLIGLINPASACQVFLIGYRSTGVLAFPRKAQGGIGRPVFCGANQFDHAGPISDDKTARSQSLGSPLPHVVLVWSSVDDAECTASTAETHAITSAAGFWRVTVPGGTSTTIHVAGETFELVPPLAESSILSPVIAAISQTTVSSEEVTQQTIQSVRGRLERLLHGLLQKPTELTSLGHIVLPTDLRWPVDEVVSQGNGALLMNPVGADSWPTLANFSVPEAIVTSSEAIAFREALAGVVASAPRSPEGGSLATESGLISQISWRHLAHESGLLASYLESYSALMMRAREMHDPAAVFWATYPLSASVWRLDGEGHCSAILLSPLHPLRLAWLVTSESTLWDADQAVGNALAGAIEGWNLPLVGPRDTSNGRVVAIPIDNGQEQVFLGWSMMVEASIDGAKALKAPDTIGDCPAPGTASSGLNAASVKAALQTYRRINPHVSTVTIDLAAASPTGRLTEVDLAVIAAIRSQSSDGLGTLGGGVRIRDSLNRQGDVPRSELAELIDDDRSTPVMWSVYKHSNQETQHCNVRLLQDAGVRVQVNSGGAVNAGVMGPYPIRRFEVPDSGTNVPGVSVASPSIQSQFGWAPFTQALGILEDADSRPQLQTSLFQTLIADPRADWTVSGESLMSPSAMASLLAESTSGEQMLWEWRPPLFDTVGGTTLLESRPFVTVVRVPGGFREAVRKLLTKVTSHEVDDAAVDRLLGELGARGVGLSSLIAIGGSHAAGAVGFYLTMGITELVVDDSPDQVVLPIDACDTFLQALAGESNHGDSRKRADLLVIQIFDDEVVLIPIEIKSYGLGAESPNPHLPAQGDHRLDEPVEQLASTYKLLKRLEARQDELSVEANSAERHLWSNGLAALIEAGLRLKKDKPNDAVRLTRQFGAIASGDSPVRIGKPVVAFFGHDAQGPDGGEQVLLVGQKSSKAEGLGDFGVVSANTGAALVQLQNGEGEVVESWRHLLEWAADRGERGATSLEGAEEASSSRDATEVGPSASKAGAEVIAENERKPAAHQSSTSAASPEIQSAKKQASAASPGSGVAVLPEPISGSGVRFAVGRLLNSVGEASAEFWPSNTNLNQMNIGVVGDLGTGKTQLLKMLMYQLRTFAAERQHSPVSMLVFDYKRDFQDAGFLDAVGGLVLAPRGIPLNIFSLPGAYSKFDAYQRANAFLDILSKIYSGIGPVQRERLVNVILELFESNGGAPPTMAAVLDSYREEAGKADAVTGVLNTFVLGEVFNDDPDTAVSFEQLISDKVLVVALSDLKADTNAKNALVVLFLNQYYEYMLTLRKWPVEGDSPSLRRLNSFLLVDEAFNIMKYEFPVLMDLMLQGREFGVGTILASQYLSHFKNGESNYGEPLLTWFIHKVPRVTTKELASLGIPFAGENNATAISGLGVHQAYYSSLDYPGRFIRGIPFYELQQGLMQAD